MTEQEFYAKLDQYIKDAIDANPITNLERIQIMPAEMLAEYVVDYFSFAYSMGFVDAYTLGEYKLLGKEEMKKRLLEWLASDKRCKMDGGFNGT